MSITQEHHTATLEALLDAALTGTAPWQQEWTATDLAAITPHNATTGRAYTGSNLLWLWLTQLALGTTDPRWATYKQAEAAGWQVRKGSKATRLIKVGTGRSTTETDTNGEPRQYTYLKTFNVFHASDIDGIPELEPAATPSKPEPINIPDALATLIATGHADVNWRTLPQGIPPHYTPAADRIVLPNLDQYPNQTALTATALHELAHWTGHSTRENRGIDTTFGSASYAAEELVADVAAFLTATELGLGTNPQNTGAYLRSWSKGERQQLEHAIPNAIAAAAKLTGLARGNYPNSWNQNTPAAPALAAA